MADYRPRSIFARGLSVILAFSTACPPSLRANPSGGSVITGDASIASDGSTVTIEQLTDRAIINWESFSIDSGELTNFIQPDALSAVLNRVTGGDPSAIYGTLQANGQVFLINPNGILVGPDGVINTQGFVASTLDVDNDAFLAGGDLLFSGDSLSGVENQGSVNALGGDVVLIAHTVSNTGEINAANGTAALAAGSEVLYKPLDDERVFVQAGGAESADVGVDQQGQIQAAAAELKAAGGNVYGLAINNEGVVRADQVESWGGRIFLTAEGGAVSNSGELTATQGELGGAVNITASQVALEEGSTIGANELRVTADDEIFLNTDIATSGNQTYNGPVVLGGDRSLSSSGGDIAFNGTVDSDGYYDEGEDWHYSDEYSLNIDAGGSISFNGVVGSNYALGMLMAGADGGIGVDPGATMSFAYDWYDSDGDAPPERNSILLGANTITFDENLDDAPFNLSLYGGNGVAFNGTVGEETPLASLTIWGTANINGGGITTDGGQTYHGPVVLGDNATLTASGGDITFNASVDSQGYDDGFDQYSENYNLNLYAGGSLSFNSAVGGDYELGSLYAQASNGIHINGGQIVTGYGQQYDGAVDIGANATLNAGEDITFHGTLDSANLSELAVVASGNVTFSDAVGGGSLGNLNVGSGGYITFRGTLDSDPNADLALTSNNDIDFWDQVGANSLGNLNLTTTEGNYGSIYFESTLDADGSVTANSDGYTEFWDNVGDRTLGGLSVTSKDYIWFYGSLNSDQSATISLNSAYDVGFDYAVGDVSLGNLDITGQYVQFYDSLDADGSVTTHVDNYTDFYGAVGSRALGGLDVTADSVSFYDTLDSDSGAELSVNTNGDATFNGAVGATSLGNLTVTVAENEGGFEGEGDWGWGGGVYFYDSLDSDGSVAVNSANNVQFSGAVGARALGGLDVTTNNGNVYFEDTLDADASVAVNSDGYTEFYGAVGSRALGGLDVTADSVSFYDTLDSDSGAELSVNTNGDATFNGAVGATSLGNLTVTVAENEGGFEGEGDWGWGGGVYFYDSLDSDGSVTAASANDVEFYGAVGGRSLGGLYAASSNSGSLYFGSTLDADGPVALNSDGYTDFSDAVGSRALGGLDVSSQESITFYSSLDSNADAALSLTSGSEIRFSGTVGAASLGDLSVTTVAPEPEHEGEEVYAGSISFQDTLDSDGSVTANSANGVDFSGAVGARSLGSLDVSASGDIGLNGGNVTTSGSQSYTGALNIGQESILSALGNVTFNGPVTAGNLEVSGVDIAWNDVLNGADIRLFGTNLLMNGDVNSTGPNGVLMVAGNSFHNSASAAINLAEGARWLIYSADPALDTQGGLSGGSQFDTTYLEGPAPSFSGNGFLYAAAAPVEPEPVIDPPPADEPEPVVDVPVIDPPPADEPDPVSDPAPVNAQLPNDQELDNFQANLGNVVVAAPNGASSIVVDAPVQDAQPGADGAFSEASSSGDDSSGADAASEPTPESDLRDAVSDSPRADDNAGKRKKGAGTTLPQQLPQ